MGNTSCIDSIPGTCVNVTYNAVSSQQGALTRLGMQNCTLVDSVKVPWKQRIARIIVYVLALTDPRLAKQ